MPPRSAGSSAPDLIRRVVAALAVAGLVLAVVGAVAFWVSAESSRAVRERRHSYEVRAAIAALRSHLQDVETGQRGYLLTGEDAHLEPFTSGSLAVVRDLARLDSLLAGDTTQLEPLAELRPIVMAKLGHASRVVRLHDEAGFAAGVALVRADSGRMLMEAVRRTIAIMDVIESQRIDRSSARVARSSAFSRATVLVGSTLAVLFVVASGMRISRDVTRRAAAEAALRESEGRLFRILEALPVGVFVLDGAGRPYYTNRVSSDLLGQGVRPDASVADLPQVYGAYVAGTNTPYPAERQPIAHAMRGERAYVDDIEIQRPDRAVPIEVWGAPVRDGDGRLEFAIAAFHDITARRAAEQRLRDVNRELETFSYSVSHDLRAPLRAIEGFCRILTEDHAAALDPEAQRLLGVVRQNTRRMGQLIDDLLAFSRMSRQDLKWGPVDMTALAQAALAELRQDGANGGATAAVEIEPLPAARGDPAMLRQVWANLVENALKYSRTRAQPQVAVGSQMKADGPVYYVRDNGVGFDMAYADKLFRVFQRLHRADEFEGTGVGLATVQRIVHRHGGRVWAEAAPEAGATFFFTLGRGGPIP